LANDFDPDGNPLSAILEVAPPPGQGSLQFNTDGSFVFTPAAGFVGVTTFIYRVSDGIAQSEPITVTITVEPVESPIERLRLFAVGAAAGGGPRVRVFNSDGSIQFDFFAMDGDETFRGGVRVAVGDVNGDGVDDVIVGAGTGGGPRVEVYNGKTGQRIANFFAYEPSFRGGVHVAAGDVDGDGLADIVTGAGSLGDPRLRVFSGALVPSFDGLASVSIHDFYAFSTELIGGVRVAVGDLDGDGIGEIVAAAGPSGDTEVRVYDGRTGVLRNAFNAFAPGFRGGLFVGVTAAPLEGRGSIVVSKDSVTDYEGSLFSNVFPGLPAQAVISPPVVAVFELTPDLRNQPTPQAIVSPYEPTFLEGVRLTGGRFAVGSQSERGFITGPGTGGDSRVRFYRMGDGTPELIADITVFEPSFRGGVFVGSSTDTAEPGLTPPRLNSVSGGRHGGTV
jgi:hypothetical protein